MAIPPKGKKEYKVYLTEKNAEYVKSFLASTRNTGGLSAIVDGYISTMAKTLKLSGYREEEKVTAKTLLKIVKNGFTQNPA
ncbi:MAG: hypothetical protein AB7U43_13080 [Desulfobacter sp.]